MGQFSVEKSDPNGSDLNGNQHRVPIQMAGSAQPTGNYSRAPLRAGIRIGGAAGLRALASSMP